MRNLEYLGVKALPRIIFRKKKLIKILNFLRATQTQVATISMDNLGEIKWYVNAAFAMHQDYKSHMGACMTLGSGTLCSISTKQKVNSRSFTEAELIVVHDVIGKILWTKLFLEHQGVNVKMNIIYQDNESSMKMEMNGKTSSGKRTRHFDIKYYYFTNLVNQNKVSIKYCSKNDMTAD